MTPEEDEKRFEIDRYGRRRRVYRPLSGLEFAAFMVITSLPALLAWLLSVPPE